jgi:hypothetical protein
VVLAEQLQAQAATQSTPLHLAEHTQHNVWNNNIRSVALLGAWWNGISGGCG